MAVLELQISADANDCEVHRYEVWTLDQTPLRVGYGGFRYGIGIRFLNVTIPKGSCIIAAHLIVTAQQSDAYDPYAAVNSIISGNDEDEAAAFSTLADYQSRCGTVCGGANNDKRTTAQVTWNDIEGFTAETEYVSPEIKTIIQEIIDRNGWVSGNPLALFWEDHAGNSDSDVWRRVYSHEASPAKAVKLYIEYLPTEDTILGITSPLSVTAGLSIAYIHQEAHICPPFNLAAVFSAAYVHQDKYNCPPFLMQAGLSIADLFPGGDIVVCPSLFGAAILNAFLVLDMVLFPPALSVVARLAWEQLIYALPPLPALQTAAALNLAAAIDFSCRDYITTYICIFSNDPALLLPMASFQGSFHLVDPAFLSVVIPGDEFEEAIIAKVAAYLAIVTKNTVNDDAFIAANIAACTAYNASDPDPGGYTAYYAAYQAAMAVYTAAVASDYCRTYEQTLNPHNEIRAYAHGAAANAARAYVRTVPMTGTPASGNTGNGICTAVSAGVRTEYGTYTLRCRLAVPGAGVFSVFDPDGRALPDAIVGLGYVHLQINFTLQAGSTDFAVGDMFSVAVVNNGRSMDTGGITYTVDYSSPFPLAKTPTTLGELSVYAVRNYHDGNQIRELIKTVDLDEDGLQIDEGPIEKSITLTGHRRDIYSPKIVFLAGESVEAIVNDKHNYRSMPDFNLHPGDTVIAQGETFSANVVSWRVMPGSEIMEVAEN